MQEKKFSTVSGRVIFLLIFDLAFEFSHHLSHLILSYIAEQLVKL